MSVVVDRLQEFQKSLSADKEDHLKGTSSIGSAGDMSPRQMEAKEKSQPPPNIEAEKVCCVIS